MTLLINLSIYYVYGFSVTLLILWLYGRFLHPDIPYLRLKLLRRLKGHPHDPLFTSTRRALFPHKPK